MQENDGAQPTFAIVTDPAAGPVLEIHERAPVMLTAATARVAHDRQGAQGTAVK